MSWRKHWTVIATFVAVSAIGATTRASLVPAVTLPQFTDVNGTFNYYSAGFDYGVYSAGWKFTVTSPITISYLGVLDWGNNSVAVSGDGLDVAIYSMDGSTTYASTTVLTSDTTTSPGGIDDRNPFTIVSDFRYHALSIPVTLAVGDYLLISETVKGNQAGNPDQGTFAYTPSIPTMASGVIFDRQWGREAVSSSAAWYPDPGEDPTVGYWGGNFLIEIPEPTSVVLLGFSALSLLRRRRAIQPRDVRRFAYQFGSK